MKHNNYVVFIVLSLLYCYPSYSASSTFQEKQRLIRQSLMQGPQPIKKKIHAAAQEPSSAATSAPLKHYRKPKKVHTRKKPTPTPFAPQQTPPPPAEAEEVPPAAPQYTEESESSTPPSEPQSPRSQTPPPPAYPTEEETPLPSPTDEDVANEELLESAALGQKGIDSAKMRTALENGADVEIKYPHHDSRFKGDYTQFPTPLFTAIAHYNDPVAAELLLLYGADTSVKNSNGKYVRNLLNDSMPHGLLLLQLIDNTREWGGKLPDEINDLGIDHIAPSIKTVANVQKFADQETKLKTLAHFNDLTALRRFYSEKNAAARDKILDELAAIPAAPGNENE